MSKITSKRALRAIVRVATGIAGQSRPRGTSGHRHVVKETLIQAESVPAFDAPEQGDRAEQHGARDDQGDDNAEDHGNQGARPEERDDGCWEARAPHGDDTTQEQAA